MSRDFDGVDDYVICPGVSGTIIPVTYCGWLYIRSSSDSRGTVFFNGSGTNGYGIVFGSIDGAGGTAEVHELFQAVRWVRFPGVGWNTNQWEFWGITHKTFGAQVESGIWRNGVLASFNQGTLPNAPTTDTTIGSENAAGGTINHTAAHWHFYDRLLSGEEMKHLMRFPGTITNGLKGYWPLFGEGSTEGDYSGNGKHGSVTGATKGTTEPGVNAVFNIPKPELIHTF